jgi:hypothetical protein
MISRSKIDADEKMDFCIGWARSIAHPQHTAEEARRIGEWTRTKGLKASVVEVLLACVEMLGEDRTR